MGEYCIVAILDRIRLQCIFFYSMFGSSTETYEEIGDDIVNKLIIMTPMKRTLDRTGDFTTRAKHQAEFNEEVEIGLRRYEEELWSAPEKDASVSPPG